MSKGAGRTARTDQSNLISNLRAEVGEIVTTWVLHAIIGFQIHKDSTGDFSKDAENQSLSALSMIQNKLYDEMVARLSELAQSRTGGLNFYFASQKLNAFQPDVAAFSKYVKSHKLTLKRNIDISHRQLPEQWTDHQHLHIPETHVLRAIAIALSLMKKIDRKVLGPASPYLWKEMRKRRYDLKMPGHIAYMLLPYLNLTPEIRSRIVKEEEAEGGQVWTEMETMVNGKPAKIRVAKQWGAIDLSSIVFIDKHTGSDQNDA
jgi:hypothetical protein